MTTGSSTEAAAEEILTAAFPHAAEELRSYAGILGTRGIEWGLMGPREGDKLWQRHIANSLALVDVISTGAEVADVGSGAGLPGLPVAIARPDLRVTLIEPLLRRANFLNEAVEELGLGDRVTVLRSRAEDIRQHFDVVICRAVAPLERLLKWTTPLFVPGGMLAALKGESAEDEIRAAGNVLRNAGLGAEVLELRAAPGVEPTRAVRVG